MHHDLKRSYTWYFFVGLEIAVLVLWLHSTQSASAQSFKWRTEQAGLGLIKETNGIAVADYDQDGDLDIYVVSRSSFDPDDRSTWNRLFSNQGDGTFSRVPSDVISTGRDSLVAESPMGYKMGASWGDFNNDGWPDLYLTNLGLNQLLKNNGDGTFSDITSAAGVSGLPNQLSSSSLWWDYDLDGDLDLYVSNWESLGGEERLLDNQLYENLGNERFIDVSQVSGLDDAGATWTSVAFDANQDGRLDLYLANDFGPNKLYINNGDKTFTDETVAFQVEDRFHGMGIALGDCDQNGFLDIYLTNITETGFADEINPLFLNTGAHIFHQESESMGVHLAGWGWGTTFFDMENDGDEDLFVATGYFDPDYNNVLFQNHLDQGEVGFKNVSTQYGLDDIRAARGMAAFDYDMDGDEDLLISNFMDVPSLYENPLAGGNYVSVSLEGTTSNRDGFGSIVNVFAGEEMYTKYHHGAQFLGQNIVPLHFGLADFSLIDSLTVHWPGRDKETIYLIPSNQSIKIKEGQGLIKGVTTSVSTEPVPEIPRTLINHGNFPNPFYESTQIQVEISRPGEALLEIYNLLGQRIALKRYYFDTPGVKSIQWAPTNDFLSSDVYMYSISIHNEQAQGKMIYIKSF